MRLARDLGMTVRELLTRIDSQELSEWMAYYMLEAEEQEQANKKASMKSGMRR
jgi:hypothetical protein